MDLFHYTTGLNARGDLTAQLTAMQERLSVVKRQYLEQTEEIDVAFVTARREIEDIYDALLQSRSLLSTTEDLRVFNTANETLSLFRIIENIRKYYRASTREDVVNIVGISGLPRYAQKTLNNYNEWVRICQKQNFLNKNLPPRGNIDVRQDFIFIHNFTSVVAEIDNEAIKGIDIKKEFSFNTNDGSLDIDLVSGDEAVNQNVTTLIGWRRGGHPVFPNVGIEADVYLGPESHTISNIHSLATEIENLADLDDLIESVTLREVRIEGTSLFLDIAVALIDGTEVIETITAG